MAIFKDQIWSKIIGIILCMLLIFSCIQLTPVRAAVNVSTSYDVTYDGETYQYSPGSTVTLTAAAISDGKYFDGFSYSSEIVYPGISYGTSTDQFRFTFIMPSCDVSIASKYRTNAWTVNTNGVETTNSESTPVTVTGRSFIVNSMLSEATSGYNQQMLPGDNIVASYGNTTVNITINGDERAYAVGQPVVITEPYVYDRDAALVITGYAGTDAEYTTNIYTGTDGVRYLQTIYLSGFSENTTLTRQTAQGCLITVADTSGNTFYKEVVQIGTSMQFAVPTRQGDYTISDITAIDANNNEVDCTTGSQTNGNTLMSVTAATSNINITFTWHNIDDTAEVNTPEVITTKTNILSTKIISTGIIQVYEASDLFTPSAQIDADDIQKNRDEIIALQKALSDTDGSGDSAIYFFHDPVITYEDGTSEQLEGWFMQRGSDIPMANDTWLQVG
ncbi:hypothetical protein [Butyrivibrio sp.]|uniref:hypothetical protein n=1 Tax=Butyrivibrio sp. TaxID=28121 RepID=UPI0025B9274C|nr:hypothetical protein [Butyrivibrio sp.]MBQ9303167.1 hypothetical protein [Butyrivibrio sp.]